VLRSVSPARVHRRGSAHAAQGEELIEDGLSRIVDMRGHQRAGLDRVTIRHRVDDGEMFHAARGMRRMLKM
jgi:hypothetical protein